MTSARSAALLLATSVAAATLAACAQPAGHAGTTAAAGAAQAPTSSTAPTPPKPPSIAQLGDSVASGEGTLYGYTYDAGSQEWTGGNIDAPWPYPFPACHDSPDAYGQVLANVFRASFHQFACTGATFANGITAPETSGGTTLRPAEFGNWATKTDLNIDYDADKPDTVLVTFGADDLQFVDIVEECIKNGYWHYFHIQSLQCTSDNPGPTVQSDFFNAIPTLKQHYATLASWITQRAQANGAPVPQVVFTDYPNPLPPSKSRCPDVSWLYADQVSYLSSLVDQLDKLIVSTVQGLKASNVAVVDIENAYQPAGADHRWCTSDPWVYGLSIYHMYDPRSFESQAPFHPTPRGQLSIAEHVMATVLKTQKAPLPVPRHSVPTAGASSTSTPGPPHP